MFERFTERARRAIFFARYEASVFGSPYIEAEHLLLGILREDANLREKMPAGSAEQIRKRIEELAPRTGQSIATSVDLPLSQDGKRALAYAAEEGLALNHPTIDSWHLLLGLLRVETSLAAVVLREVGITLEAYRSQPPESVRPSLARAKPDKGPLELVAVNLKNLLDAAGRLEEQRNQRLKRPPWTRKQALGHLIDWGAAHQQWFACALAEPSLTARGYPEDDWLAAQKYDDFAWLDIVELWCALNRFLVHVIENIPEKKLDTPCKIGIAEPVTLQQLARRYVAHCEDIVGQLLMMG